ncbi:MAG: hypothetical protein U0T69_09475 [Chitinophagales bacterium]
MSCNNRSSSKSEKISFKTKRKDLISKFKALDISSEIFKNTYTIEYQSLLKDSTNNIAFTGYVYDIIRLDSNNCKIILVSEHTDNPLNFIAEIVVDNAFYKNILDKIYDNEGSQGIYILEVSKICKSNNPVIQIGETCSSGREPDCDTYAYISNENDYILLNGMIKDYYLESDN